MSRVLLVEDDIFSVMLVSSLLEDAGHQIEHADTTDAALSSVERCVPDILLSDWSIDGSVSPSDVARLVRKKNPDARIVFITGRSAEEIQPFLNGIEPFKLYRKPVEYEAIIEQL